MKVMKDDVKRGCKCQLCSKEVKEGENIIIQYYHPKCCKEWNSKLK